MTTVLIADDEPQLAQDLATRLARLWPSAEVVAMPYNGLDALSEIHRTKPDIAFLDIRMPGLSGVRVAELVSDLQIVFVTAFDEYAVKAFEVSAFDYLIKPLNDERVLKCISKLQQSRGSFRDAHFTNPLQESSTSAAPIRWLTVGYQKSTRLVSIEDVLYFQSMNKYTDVVTKDCKYTIRMSLKEIYVRLDSAQFAQVHRSAIVALAHVDRIERDIFGRMSVHLKGIAEVLYVSRAHARSFKEL